MQQGAENCRIALYPGLSTCGVSPPPPHSAPRVELDQSINASQAKELLLRSPSANFLSAYSTLIGPIGKLHPAPRLQEAAAASCEPSVEPCFGSHLVPGFVRLRDTCKHRHLHHSHSYNLTDWLEDVHFSCSAVMLVHSTSFPIKIMNTLWSI